jgi:hypothetical protein
MVTDDFGNVYDDGVYMFDNDDTPPNYDPKSFTGTFISPDVTDSGGFMDPTTGQYTNTYLNADGSLKQGWIYDDQNNIVADPNYQGQTGGYGYNKSDTVAPITKEENDALIKSGFKTDPSTLSGIKNTFGSAFTKKDKNGNILKDADGNPLTDWASIAALGGAGLGAYKALTEKPVLTGYQGTIPKYDAHRNMITAPPSDRRPGAGGVNYGGDVAYTPRGAGLNTFNTPRGTINAPSNPKDQVPELPPSVREPLPPDMGYLAQGGIAGYAKGRYLQGTTDGMADKIPAKIGRDQPAALSHGEFVVPADVVSHLGNGNSDAGAKKLYQMMDRIRMARTGTKKQGKEINPNSFMPGGNVGYASGGEIKHFVDGGATTSGVGTAANAGVRGTESNLSNWAGDYVTNMLGKGEALSNMPYEAYQGPLTAGASNLQNQAFNQASNLSVPSGINQAANTAGNISAQAQNMSYAPTTFGNQFNAPTAYDPTQFSTGQFGTQQAQQYMNPYLKASLDPQIEEARRQSQITQMQNDAKMTGAGAFGGGRSAILNAETQRSLGTNLANITGQGYNTAFTNAQQQFNADQARQLQAQQAGEQSKQFGYGQGMTAAQQAAQYGLAGQQASEASKQFGANYGLQGLNTALQGAQTQGQLGTAQNQAQLGNLNALAGLGGTQRGIESEGIAADKAAFEEARANPYKMVQYQQSLLNGLPLAAQSYNMAPTNALTQAAQGAQTVGSLLGNLGLK